MNERNNRVICPFLEATHSKAFLFYVCESSGKEIAPEDISKFPCFTDGYKRCKDYKKCGRK